MSLFEEVSSFDSILHSLTLHTEENILTGEFFTSKQRASSSLHEVPYRGCFKANIPNFFIKHLTKEEDVIYDPFSGRGTVGVEAGLLRRNAILNDINPLSKILSKPRFHIPNELEVRKRMDEVLKNKKSFKHDLYMFYEKETQNELNTFKEHFKNNEKDYIDEWISLIITTRLSGHSSGYLSVYTLPPNQATSKKRQMKINEQRKQKPEYRSTKEIVLKKTKQILRNVSFEEKNNLKQVKKTFFK